MTDQKTTIADVARRAGVSRGAVSFALNNRPGVAEATRRRILDTAAELGWSPSLRGRALSTAQSYAVGLVIARSPEVVGADPFFPAFIAGAETVLAPRQRSLLVTLVPDDAAEAATYRRLAGEGRVDGVFVSDLRRADPRIDLLGHLGLPVVTLGTPDIASPFPAVGPNDTDAVAEVVAALALAGHRRIAHVAGPQHFLHAARRADAWRVAVRAAGLRPGPLVVTDFTAAGGAAATRRLLGRPTPPTAIVYGNDIMAIAGLAAAQRLGLRVPDDLSVTGFDDTELARYVNPALTSVNTDVIGWGRQAARTMLDLITGERPQDVSLAPATMVLRASLGPAPTRPPREGARA